MPSPVLTLLKEITLNLDTPNDLIYVAAKQYDVLARKVKIKLVFNNAPWVIPSGLGGVIRYIKPDQTRGMYDTDDDGNPAIVITAGSDAASPGDVTITLAKQVLTTKGTIKIEVSLYSAAAEKLTTFSFPLVVEEAALGDIPFYESENYFNFRSDMATIQQLNDAFKTATNTATSELGLTIDNTLSIAGAIADAKAAGDMLRVSEGATYSGDSIRLIDGELLIYSNSVEYISYNSHGTIYPSSITIVTPYLEISNPSDIDISMDYYDTGYSNVAMIICFDNNFDFIERITLDSTNKQIHLNNSTSYIRVQLGFSTSSGMTIAEFGLENLLSLIHIHFSSRKIKDLQKVIDISHETSITEIPSLTNGLLTINGAYSSNSNFHCTDFIDITNYGVIVHNFYNTVSGTDYSCFYDSNKEFITSFKNTLRRKISIPIPNNASYIRLSSRKSHEETEVDRFIQLYPRITSLKPNNSLKVVMLGDSIIGNYEDDTSIPSMIGQFNSAECYNCAFGGSNLATDTVGGINTYLLPFRGFKVIEAITTNNYSDIDNAIASDPTFSELKDYYQMHVNILKSMDWSTVDLLTMSYGTNDYGTSVTLDDDENNLKNTDTFGGALRTALETLWSVYPNIKVMIFGTIWRGGTITDQELNYDSDNRPNSIGKYLIEYEQKLKSVAEEYHVPFVPMYNYTNFNRYTWKSYFSTNSSNALHPTYPGRYVMAKRYAHFISQI